VLQTRLLTMSALELDRPTVIERVDKGRLTQVEASKRLGVTPRHLRRLMRDFDNDGAQALVSKKRGKRSNRAYADTVKARIVELIRNHIDDHDRVVYLLEPNDVTNGLRRKKVRVHDYPDGTIAIEYKAWICPTP
jgi:transposase